MPDNLHHKTVTPEEQIDDLQRSLSEALTQVADHAAALEAKEREVDELRRQKCTDVAEDGFGNVWPPCVIHGCKVTIVRPGKAVCQWCEAAETIEELKADVAQKWACMELMRGDLNNLTAELERVKAERDAARRWLVWFDAGLNLRWKAVARGCTPRQLAEIRETILGGIVGDQDRERFAKDWPASVPVQPPPATA